jgi:hypothetical protein
MQMDGKEDKRSYMAGNELMLQSSGFSKFSN